MLFGASREWRREKHFCYPNHTRLWLLTPLHLLWIFHGFHGSLLNRPEWSKYCEWGQCGHNQITRNKKPWPRLLINECSLSISSPLSFLMFVLVITPVIRLRLATQKIRSTLIVDVITMRPRWVYCMHAHHIRLGRHTFLFVCLCCSESVAVPISSYHKNTTQ